MQKPLFLWKSRLVKYWEFIQNLFCILVCIYLRNQYLKSIVWIVEFTNLKFIILSNNRLVEFLRRIFLLCVWSQILIISQYNNYQILLFQPLLSNNLYEWRTRIYGSFSTVFTCPRRRLSRRWNKLTISYRLLDTSI